MGYAEAQYTVDEVINALQQMGANESGIPPIKPWVTVVPAAQSVKVYFTIKDTVIENQTVCHCKGVMIRKKLGSPITSLTDGDLVGIYEDDAAKSHGPDGTPITISGLENGVRVWIGVWAFSDHNVYNLDMSNVYQVQPGVDIIYGFHQDFTDLNPLTSITYIGANAQFEPMYTRERNAAIRNDTKASVYSTPEPRKSPTYGSWKTWSWLNKNQPFFLKRNVTTKKVYVENRLKSSDYHIDADTGEPITDAENLTVDYVGYFAWLPIIYTKEVYDANGNGRTVYFSETKLTSSTSDFSAANFTNLSGQTVNGLWIAMNLVPLNQTSYKVLAPLMRSDSSQGQYTLGFYGTQTNAYYMQNMGYNYSALFTAIKSWKTSDGVDAFLFGGRYRSLIRDLLYLLYKSTDIPECIGYGLTPLKGIGVQSNIKYNSNGSYVSGDSSSLQVNNRLDSRNYESGFFYYGPFSGADASYVVYHDNGSTNYTMSAIDGYSKVFHCMSLGTNLFQVPDFELVSSGSYWHVCKNHNYDVSGFTTNYQNTNIPSLGKSEIAASGTTVWPSRLKQGVYNTGSYVDLSSSGSSSTTGLACPCIKRKLISTDFDDDTTLLDYAIPTFFGVRGTSFEKYYIINAGKPSSDYNYFGYDTITGFSTLKPSTSSSQGSRYYMFNVFDNGILNAAMIPVIIPPTNYTPYDDYEGGVPSQW